MATTPTTATAISGFPAASTLVTGDLLIADIGGATKKIAAGSFRTALFAIAQTDPLSIGALTVVGNSTITGTLSGVTTLTLSTLAQSVTNGEITLAGRQRLLNNWSGSFGAGTWYKSATLGIVIAAATGSVDDLYVADPTGNPIMVVPTGTRAVTFGAGATFAGAVGGITTLALSGTMTQTGIATEHLMDGRLRFTGNTSAAFAAASLYRSATHGIALSANTGSSNDFIVADPTGNLILNVPTGTKNATFGGSLILSTAVGKIVPGATSISHRNNADSADNLLISDAGVVTVRSNLVLATAASKVIPGATSLSFRNNADTNDNLIIVDLGSATFRAAVTVGTNLSFTAATAKIIRGGTSLSIRDNADTTDLMLFNSAGITLANSLITTASVTGAAGFNLPHGTAPTSPVNGDFWSTTTTLNFRLNGVTKSITMT